MSFYFTKKGVVTYHTHTKRKPTVNRRTHERLRNRLRAQTQRTLEGALLVTYRRPEERALPPFKLRRNHGRPFRRVHRLIPNHTG